MNFNNNNYLLWVIVSGFLILGFILSLYILFQQNYQDSTGISFIIILLFLLFYALNIYNTLYFYSEYELIINADNPSFDFLDDNIEYSGSLLFEKHINNLMEIYNNIDSGFVNQDHSIDYLSNKLSRREYFVQLGSNIMITLGLIGTISGLIISITGLEQVMTSLGDDGTVVVGGLKQALDGMGTAFYTTLFGAVLGGFFLKLLHQASINIADEVLDEIALKTEIFVLPYLSKTVESNINSQTKMFSDYIKQSEVLIKSESDNLKKYMNEISSLESSIQSLNEKIKSHEEEIGSNHLSALRRIESVLNKIQEQSKPFLKRFFG